MDTFVLACELRLHEQDVKAVCALSGGGIASGSRDRATVVWEPAEDGERPPFRATSTHSLHEHFVNSVCEFGQRQVASGSGSGNVGGLRLWDVAAGSDAAVQAAGHTKNVCALATAPNGDLLSGSWDHTARVWRGGETVAVLQGHESAVWAVLGLDSGALVTGSGDKTIKLWQDGVCVKTLTGHTDSVRALQRVPGIGFISASNDGTVKLWSSDGDELASYACHEQYIYSVAVLSSSEFATCSEDKSLKVFKDGQPAQTIQHPGVVWSVAVLPDGDLVTGCQDGVVRVWTRSAERVAAAEEIAMYEEQLAAQTISSQEAGNVDPSKLPGPEALEQPGDSDGQVKLVRSANGGAEAHSWSAAEMRWVMVGTVVDGPGGAGGGTSGGVIAGVTYDYVFDVDLEDGSPMRKLGVNRGEDPMMAAYRFLETEGVPTSSANVDQITQFIEQQVGAGFTIGDAGGASSGPIDPLTGTGAWHSARVQQIVRACLTNAGAICLTNVRH
jgi:phospholipase A-2-activating protein